MLPRLSLLLLLLLVAACDRAPNPPPAKPVAAACVSRPEGSRWAGDYRETARFGDTDDEALGGMDLASITVGDGIVYVLEASNVGLWLLRPDLTVIRKVGREGDGPGEWRGLLHGWQGGSSRWVSASSDRVRLFDGKRFQELTPGGRFRRVLELGSDEMPLFLQSRLIFAGDTLFYSAGGYDPFSSASTGEPRDGRLGREVAADGYSPWTVRMRLDGENRELLRLGLVPVHGKWGVGPAHAIPLWDTNGGCVVASDGHEPVLVYATVGGRQDTLPVPVPNHVERIADYAEALGGLLPGEAKRREPATPKRIRDLVIDPDGWVWLWTVRKRGSTPGEVQVLRVPLGGGRAVLDTVPAFPRAFGPPGVYYAQTYGPDDELLVARYDLRK